MKHTIVRFASAAPAGDINGDGVVNARDVSAIQKAILD